jgi:hypothetical protein
LSRARTQSRKENKLGGLAAWHETTARANGGMAVMKTWMRWTVYGLYSAIHAQRFHCRNGHKLMPGADFCPHCGAALVKQETPIKLHT